MAMLPTPALADMVQPNRSESADLRIGHPLGPGWSNSSTSSNTAEGDAASHEGNGPEKEASQHDLTTLGSTQDDPVIYTVSNQSQLLAQIHQMLSQNGNGLEQRP